MINPSSLVSIKSTHGSPGWYVGYPPILTVLKTELYENRVLPASPLQCMDVSSLISVILTSSSTRIMPAQEAIVVIFIQLYTHYILLLHLRFVVLLFLIDRYSVRAGLCVRERLVGCGFVVKCSFWCVGFRACVEKGG